MVSESFTVFVSDLYLLIHLSLSQVVFPFRVYGQNVDKEIEIKIYILFTSQLV